MLGCILVCWIGDSLVATERVRFSVDDVASGAAASRSSLFVVPNCSNNELVKTLEHYFLLYGTFRADSRDNWSLRINRDGEKWSLILSETGTDTVNGRTFLQDVAARELSKDDVNLLYDTWVNLLLGVRYGPRKGPAGTGITTHYISAFTDSIGFMSAVSLNHDRSPAIMLLREVADELRAYVVKPLSTRRRLPVQLTLKIQELDLMLDEEIRR